MDLVKVLKDATRKWDGGYVVAGLIGHGDSFIVRDPAGIRPAFYYQDDEIVVAASERPVIQTAFNVAFDTIKEVPPAHALIVRRDGSVSVPQIMDALPKRACSFERIYFSRGTDADIYQERKQLGRHLARKILEKIHDDLEHTVFSFIPNTAETCYMGLVQELGDFCNRIRAKASWPSAAKPTPRRRSRTSSPSAPGPRRWPSRTSSSAPSSRRTPSATTSSPTSTTSPTAP
jgi:amidophosphoribosyltransferase